MSKTEVSLNFKLTNNNNESVKFEVPNGKSAYEIWLEQTGNAGKSEEDFLNSLKASSDIDVVSNISMAPNTYSTPSLLVTKQSNGVQTNTSVIFPAAATNQAGVVKLSESITYEGNDLALSANQAGAILQKISMNLRGIGVTGLSLPYISTFSSTFSSNYNYKWWFSAVSSELTDVKDYPPIFKKWREDPNVTFSCYFYGSQYCRDSYRGINILRGVDSLGNGHLFLGDFDGNTEKVTWDYFPFKAGSAYGCDTQTKWTEDYIVSQKKVVGAKYLNETGAPIQLCIMAKMTDAAVVSVSDEATNAFTDICFGSSVAKMNITPIIPAGTWYSVQNALTWHELIYTKY